MLQDRLQYFSVDSQHQNQESQDKQSHNRSQSNSHNRSHSGGKSKSYSDIQVITPTKKESNEIKSNITNILNQVLQRTNNIPFETQLYFKERFNTQINTSAMSSRQLQQQQNQSISPNKNSQSFSISQRNNNNKNQDELNSIKKKKQDQLKQLEYLDKLINEEKEGINENNYNITFNNSPSMANQNFEIKNQNEQQPNVKLQVEQLLKDIQNFDQNRSQSSHQLNQTTQLSQTKNNNHQQQLSKTIKNIIQQNNTQSNKKSPLINKDKGINNINSIQDKQSQNNKIKDLSMFGTESINIQDLGSVQKQQNKIQQYSSRQKKSMTSQKENNNNNLQQTSAIKNKLNSAIEYQQDSTIYQRILRDRQTSLITQRQNKTQGKSDQHNNNYSSSVDLGRGVNSDKYFSVKKELFKDFQSISDQFVSEKATISVDQEKNKSIYTNRYLSSQKKMSTQRQDKQIVKQQKQINDEINTIKEQNDEKKSNIIKQNNKLNKDINYLQKLKKKQEDLKQDNKRLIDPLKNKNNKNEEKQAIEKNIKRQEIEIKQLEKNNLTYQAQLKQALEELSYWQNKDKPKEIKMSLVNSANSSTFDQNNPQIHIKISQSDIYNAISNNVYNGQTYL